MQPRQTLVGVVVAGVDCHEAVVQFSDLSLFARRLLSYGVSVQSLKALG